MSRKDLCRVLCIEDNQDILAVLRFSLESIGGFEVRISTNPAEVPTAITEFKPDLVLLDRMLPGTDGLELIRKLPSLAGDQGLPVVFLTAKSQDKDIREMLATGALDVIPKPFDAIKLPDQLKEIWGRSRSQKNEV